MASSTSIRQHAGRPDPVRRPRLHPSQNIDKPVFSEIVRVYEKQKEHGKQVFLVYDTLASYDAGAQRILEKNAVLRLSPAGNELFGWAWNKEEKNDADETS